MTHFDLKKPRLLWHVKAKRSKSARCFPIRVHSNVVQVLVALGSNVGESLVHLQEATALLASQMKLLATSRIYETAPMYVENQAAFLNAAILLETDWSPLQVLATLKQNELQIGRQKRQQNGPREIDLDLIAYGCLAYSYREGHDLRLQIPHPRLRERRFVLEPLADIAPEYVIPGMGPVITLLSQTEHQRESVRTIEHALLPIQGLG